ncbi:GH92 family glycosyl hydrolase [Chitinophaga japonensis]|uniref:Putative alpha-1,2-mannosidase n=1 Tax=Chitinophaga japonensis TaxID=104662 RepID=A0A562SZX7_CHIJA|nr:GH92 family glycosyl hydrolase [Chitinophaga japonensis]TWI86386.1 putative alpha-1,2-mannosidase [Chitinophaga japonensis]
MNYCMVLMAGVALAAGAASCKTATVNNSQAASGYTKYVNPFIGTAPLTDPKVIGYTPPENWRVWAGLTYPGSSLPNAMVQLSPITEYHSGAGYEYEDTVIYGFTHTNKGHWNLCYIPVLPVSNTGSAAKDFGARFTHEREAASPAFYQVFLEDYKVDVRLTSTLRCGYHQYRYEDGQDRRILFDLAKSNERVREWQITQVGDSAVQGYQQFGRSHVYFYATLNKRIENLEQQAEGSREGYAMLHVSGRDTGAVELKIGLSFVSAANAQQNLAQEIGNKSFEEVLQEGVSTWEALLSKVRVKGGTEKQKQLFYSSLYRAFLWPALRSDVNGEYTDADGKTVKADFNYYTVPSLWDTYRNKLVLLDIVSPKVAEDVIRSLVDIGEKRGFIPTFFHGDHAASFITGAYLRGIRGFDVQRAYQLLLKNANEAGGTRPHIEEYIAKGYISDPDVANPHVETKAKAGVSKTLEYAYDDYSLAQLARQLGDSAQYRTLMERSGNYKNVFDPSTRFMRGRLENGDWIKNFNPQYPYYEYMYREANAWQVSFFAPHDMNGLVALYGGKESFEAKLDSLFSVPWNPQYIARNVSSFIGQYCHGNQPDHEAPFAYYFTGKPEKSQRIIDHILDSLYGIGPEGLALCGMDDAGEMSSWYVFSASGLYPFSATDPAYLVTVPVFDEVQWHLDNGNVLTLKKPAAGRHLDAIQVDGKGHEGYFVPHELFRNGGSITIVTK